MGITQHININVLIRQRLMREPESLLKIEVNINSIILVFDGGERFPIVTKPQMIDILKGYTLKSWKVFDDLLSLNYEEQAVHIDEPSTNVLCSTSRLH